MTHSKAVSERFEKINDVRVMACRVYGGYMEGVWRVSGGYMEGIWKVYGGYMEGKD